MSFKKNTAVTGFVVHLVSATDGSDITTGTPVGYYTLDGGAQTAIGDVTPVHEGNGQWSFDLLAAEMNGDIVGLVFTHASAITASFTIKTDTKIVSDLNDLGGVAQTADNSTHLTALTNRIIGTLAAGTHNPATAAQIAVLSDWIDAGRLDTILDTINTSTAGLAGAAMRGTDSALLAASAPTNFSDLAITVTTGRVDVNANNDKTGYTLTQAFPTNFADMSITATTGLVSVGTLPTIPTNWITATGIAASALNGKGDWNVGKTGYTLTQTFPANFASTVISVTGDVNSDVNKINGVTITGDGSATPFDV